MQPNVQWATTRISGPKTIVPLETRDGRLLSRVKKVRKGVPNLRPFLDFGAANPPSRTLQSKLFRGEVTAQSTKIYCSSGVISMS